MTTQCICCKEQTQTYWIRTYQDRISTFFDFLGRRLGPIQVHGYRRDIAGRALKVGLGRVFLEKSRLFAESQISKRYLSNF